MTMHLNELATVGAVGIAGHYLGRAAKLVKLPSLVGYMVLGVVIGPSLLNVYSHEIIEHTSFITEVALGFVAFSIGSELNLGSLRKLGKGIVSIILAESLTAFFVVLGFVWLFTRNLPLSLIFASVAPASAPAGTVAVIHEYKAKGTLTQALYAVVGFDDGLAIIIFGFAAALAKSLLMQHATGESVGILMAMKGPCLEIILSLVVGLVGGLGFNAVTRKVKGASLFGIMLFSTVLLLTGLSTMFHLSLILTNMTAGLFVVNTKREEFVHAATEPLRFVMPYLFILFFTIAGAHLELTTLPKLGLLGLVYIAGRTIGLIGGARIGSAFGNVSENVKKYIGLGILSQAGVAIGLSLIVQQDFAEMVKKFPEQFKTLAAEMPTMDPLYIGASVITTITATCIVFEIMGPICTKIALEKAGEIRHNEE